MYDNNLFEDVRRAFSLEEAYRPEPLRKYDYPMEVESLVKQRAKQHIAKLNAADPDHEYSHRFHYKGPRENTRPPGMARGSRPASTPKRNAHAFSVAIYKRRKGAHHGYQGTGTLQGYVLPHHIGVHPHATKNLAEKFSADASPYPTAKLASKRYAQRRDKAIADKVQGEFKRSKEFNKDPKNAQLATMFKKSHLSESSDAEKNIDHYVHHMTNSWYDDREFNKHLENLSKDKSMTNDHIREIDRRLGKRKLDSRSYMRPKANRENLIHSLSARRVTHARNVKSNIY